jgi:hypothetical protein
MSRDVQIAPDAGGVFNCWRFVQYGRTREWRYRRADWIYILKFL